MRRLGQAISTLLIGWFLVVAGAAAAALAIRLRGPGRPEPEDDRLDLRAAFEPVDLRSRSAAFRGGSIVTMFGRASLDLRRVTPSPEGPHLEVTTVFGSTEITVPDGWLVAVIGPTVMGARRLEVTDPADTPPGAPRLTLSARTFAGDLHVVSRAVLRATG